MYKLLLLTFLFTFSFAKNPIVYAALGDIIYNNVDKIAKLKNIEIYKENRKDINLYLSDVKKTKKYGFDIQKNLKKDKNIYLNQLRKLSKKNDFYIRNIDEKFHLSMKENNYKLFMDLVNNNLIDESYKNSILEYYFKHSSNIKLSGVLEKYVQDNQKLKDKNDMKKRYLAAKKHRENDKINRIRKADKEAQDALEKKLEEELRKKKDEIIKEQQRELL